jgi:hypothetical protein
VIPAAPGTCYGTLVVGDVPLRFLRPGSSPTRLEVREWQPGPPPAARPLLSFTATAADGSPARAAIHRLAGQRFLFDLEDVGSYDVDAGQGRIGVPACEDEVRREQMLWNVPAMLCALARSETCLHAAAVEVDSRALLLAAPGRHGKTTLALAFHEAGLRMLSEDVACVRPETVELLPGPALLRVREGLLEGRRPDGLCVAATRPGRVEFAVAPDRRGTGSPLPLAAIVLLRESEQTRLEHAVTSDVVRDLFGLSFFLPDDDSRAACFEAAAAIASRIPAWNLHRPLRREALQSTVEAIVEGIAA